MQVNKKVELLSLNQCIPVTYLHYQMNKTSEPGDNTFRATEYIALLIPGDEKCGNRRDLIKVAPEME